MNFVKYTHTGSEYSLSTSVGTLDFDKYGLAPLDAEQETELTQEIESVSKHIFVIVSESDVAELRAEIDAQPVEKTAEELNAEQEAADLKKAEQKAIEAAEALKLEPEAAEKAAAEQQEKELSEAETEQEIESSGTEQEAEDAEEQSSGQEQEKETIDEPKKKGGRPPKYT